MEKIIKKESLKLLLESRLLFASVIIMNLIALTLAIVIIFLIKPSELQLITHYSAFGITHLYRSQWYYLYSFVLFEILVSVLHSFIAIKVLIVKGRPLALLTVWSGILILLLGFSTALSVINVWNPLI